MASRPSPNCDGISSASIWQKITSYLLPLKLWDNMFWEPISKPECGDRPALLCRIHNWIPCKIAITRSLMDRWYQPWQMPFQLQRPSLRWLAVNAKKKTVLLADVLAEQRTYAAPICANAVVSVRTMRTRRRSMKLMMAMMVTICKDSWLPKRLNHGKGDKLILNVLVYNIP